MRRRRLNVVLNVLLVVVAALLGIVTNYATGDGHAPLLLELLQKVAGPAIGVLLLALIILTVAMSRLDNPPPPSRVWDSSRTPYPGLEAFAEDEAAVFFGCDGQINDLIRELQGDDRGRFVVVTGASGSGKSSLVQAGLIPRLRGRRWLVPPVLTPGSDPDAALARALDGTDNLQRFRTDATALIGMLADLRQRNGRRNSRILLAVDQMEELFTLAGPDQRDRFLASLDAALQADPRLWVLATVRIEFLRSFLETGHAALFGRPVALGALTRSDLATVIEAPGALADFRFAPGLVTKVVEDTETADALPLLAYLLQELYFSAGRSRTATFEDYARLGGVAGALARQADQVVTSLPGNQGIEPILAVLFKFVTSDGAEATRRRVPLSDLTADERRIVDAFVEARLLVVDVSDGAAIAQVAHEALFRQWAPLRQEVEARSELLRQRAELERWAADWQHSGRKADYLLTGERLQLALQWLDSLHSEGQSTDPIRTFVEASKRRDLVFLRRVSEGIGEYVLNNVEQYPELALLLSLAALSECPPTPAATRALMAALAFSHLTEILHEHTDAVRNLAWSPDGRFIATASRDGTCRIWDAGTGACLQVLAGHGGMVEMVAWSPDSSRVATASRDQTVRIWNVVSGLTLAELIGAADVVRAVAWSPDGSRIASGSRDRIVRLWDAETYGLVEELRGHADNILGVAFSPNSEYLATGSHDRTVRIWSLSPGPGVVLEGHQDFVEGVSWSPDGLLVASAGGDGTARVWDTLSGAQIQLIRCHESRVWNVAWSPDGTRLATCGSDSTARVWDPANSEELFVLRGHSSDVWAVDWSPDGSRLVTGSADTTTRIWDASPRGAETVQMTSRRGTVRGVSLAPSGGHVATCTDDGDIHIWDCHTGWLVAQVTEHDEIVHDVAWAQAGGTRATLLSCSSDRTIGIWNLDEAEPQGVSGDRLSAGEEIPEAVTWNPNLTHPERFAVGGHDRKIRIWDAENRRPLFTLDGHEDWVTGLAWSPRGGLIASTSDDRTARIWDVRERREVAVLLGHTNWVDSVSWSPDERRVVTGSADGTARVWDAGTGQLLATLSGHEGRVSGVAWSPDGFMIATASHDRTVRLWAGRTFAEIGVTGVHRAQLTSIGWTPDSMRIITGSFDGTARSWPVEVDLDALKDKARARVFRPLAGEERLAHLLPGEAQ